ncbi:MAG: hypothetical protein ACRD3Q_18585 [Terriglobales bacterium]
MSWAANVVLWTFGWLSGAFLCCWLIGGYFRRRNERELREVLPPPVPDERDRIAAFYRELDVE